MLKLKNYQDGNLRINTIQNLTKGDRKQKIVAFIKGTGHIQKSTLDKPLITPQVRLGKTEDEILNNIITELQYSIQYDKFK